MASLFGQSLSLLLVIVGIGLIVAEALAPGAHFIVLGVALLFAGLIGVLLGSVIPGVASPIVLSLLVLGIGALALYAYRNLDIYGGKGTGRTSNSESLRNATGRVTERVTSTDGQVKLENGGFNPIYAARSASDDIPVGTEVIVVDPGGGNVVTVESLAGAEDPIDRELAAERRDDEQATEHEEA